ncbi:MAG: hypothetical protein QHC90_25845 [Shinella sp.]|nr:hypothetical protein [Shinella sp.]
MQPTLVSKSEFAAMINVSPGRVSQYLKDGSISPAAVHGIGQRAKIDPERARADLRLTLDVSQRLGNGIDTRLDDEPAREPPSSSQSPAQPAPVLTGIDYEIKQQKLEQARRANRNGAIAEAQARGQLVDTAEVRAEMSRLAVGMMQVFEGGLTDLASAIAAQFMVPQRDVLHLLRKQFRTIRASAAKQMNAAAIVLPETVQTELSADDMDVLN